MVTVVPRCRHCLPHFSGVSAMPETLEFELKWSWRLTVRYGAVSCRCGGSVFVLAVRSFAFLKT
ncbi:hypothetical protein TSUD_141930 [Trifolium subterraneum]|uniref:Uncharacterized protein n=1 Tax=Trifolium subterraneum TaxID=3900 RepID=A0A2Z6LGH1_TRISU|nr:hypothetical protein TSUD_141930 [Trifolium subterraneum]